MRRSAPAFVAGDGCYGQAEQVWEVGVHVRQLVVLALVMGGLSVAGCAPSINSDAGGTIRGNLLWPGSDTHHAMAMADQYCSQFGRSAHLASEEQGWLSSDTVRFECVN
jgi:hypothetical protein